MTEQGWRKSSYSGGQGGNCVEVATRAEAGSVMVRDSKDQAGPVLSFPREAWQVFCDTALEYEEGPGRCTRTDRGLAC